MLLRHPSGGDGERALLPAAPRSVSPPLAGARSRAVGGGTAHLGNRLA
jgi:hypothetical protein